MGILRRRVAVSGGTCAFTRESAPLLVRWSGVGILRRRGAISGDTCAFTRESAPLLARWLGVSILQRRVALSGFTCARTRGSALPETLLDVGTLLQRGAPSIPTPSANTNRWRVVGERKCIFHAKHPAETGLLVFLIRLKCARCARAACGQQGIASAQQFTHTPQSRR